jgi:hypothetical protein
MALINDYPLPLGLPPARVYVMLAQAALNRLEGVVDVHLALFASAGTRQSFKEAQAAFERLEAEGRTLKTRYDALQPGAADEAALVRAIKRHQIEFEAAVEALRRIVPQMDPNPVRVPKDQVENVMSDGDIDLAKLYAWLKAQPQFQNAVDA